ncbi:MAG TPA: vanadium-dependent haloperoxidase [Chitinophagaceae bacterium]|nr:vanadium-dependent haloperoxidase [Chitinophagaceae bacterium]
MKHTKNLSKNIISLLLVLIIFVSCQKGIDRPAQLPEEVATASSQTHGHLVQTNRFPATVAQKWQDLQNRFLRTPTNANPFGRHGHRWFAYTGIALYEAVVPGMPAYQSLDDQLTDMPDMPETEPGRAYHWPTVANAALAFMNKKFFTTANVGAANVTSMDSLENALNTQYQSELNNQATFQRSKDFGKTVAERVFNWSTTDGSLNSNPPYVMAALPLWQPTAPNPSSIVDPYWGNNRLLVQGSTTGIASPPPPPYSTVPGSAYYNMVKEVYDVSQTLTPGQLAAALYYRDQPGFQAGTAYIAMFNQIMNVENPQLDFYALAHAKTGIAIYESMISCWKIKYEVLLDRPIRYIRNVLGHATWSPVFNTPGHPDYPSGHSQNGGAFAAVMTTILGDNYQFTLHTYDNLGMAPRTYSSFDEMAVDVGRSRVYAGIHYTYSCVEGKAMGEKIAQNVLNILKFKKD